MDFNLYFEKFIQWREKLNREEKRLEEEFIDFIQVNRKHIKENLPKKGEIVEYIGEKSSWDDHWKYIRVTDNRLIAKLEYRDCIPKIGGIPLNENMQEIQSYYERIPITSIKRLQKHEIDKQSTIGYVYLLNVINTDIYKIGFSEKPENRTNNIQTNSPFDIRIIAVYKCFFALKTEKELHNSFISKKVNREWFALTENDIVELEDILSKNLIKKYLDFPYSTNENSETEDLDFDLYEIEKDEIREKFEKLKADFINGYSKHKVGERTKDINGDTFVIKNIQFIDTLESLKKDIFISYGGNKILKSGKESERYNPFVILYLNENSSVLQQRIAEVYFKNKSEIRKELSVIKSRYKKEGQNIKKGDKVKDVFGRMFLIDKVEFNDLLEWKKKAYFNYIGYEILKSGNISKKRSTYLHRIEKAD